MIIFMLRKYTFILIMKVYEVGLLSLEKEEGKVLKEHTMIKEPQKRSWKSCPQLSPEECSHYRCKFIQTQLRKSSLDKVHKFSESELILD